MAAAALALEELNPMVEKGTSFSEIVSALTFAIDMTEGAVPGHALRSCVLGMRMGARMGLPAEEMQGLYYALLLKDIGCSSNAARVCQIVGGDDLALKKMFKVHDWTSPHKSRRAMLQEMWGKVLPEAGALRRVGRIAMLAMRREKNNQELISLRCERGADIARKLGLSVLTADAIQALDERWDGTGYPCQAAGEAVPVLARILAVAQHLDVFACEEGREVALEVMAQRSGTWFDPAVVAAAAGLAHDGELWTLEGEAAAPLRQGVLEMDPGRERRIAADEIDQICEAFADVVDAKSPFTYRHSIGVARVSVQIGYRLRLDHERVQLVRRAALLHDLGKLSIPNTILDKRTALTSDEWKIVSAHSRLSREILERIEAFAEIAAIAGAHHERLDGTGYPEGLRGEDLGLEARIVAVADAYQAMTEGRPYRVPMSHAAAVRALREDTPAKLDRRCVDALA